MALSKRWIKRGRCSPSDSASSMPSMWRPPCPVPPWTAMPAGLLRMNMSSSSWTMRGFKKARALGFGVRGALQGPSPSFAALDAKGGKRTAMPAISRVLALARAPSTRIWPVRSSLANSPCVIGNRRFTQRSSRTPLSFSETVSVITCRLMRASSSRLKGPQ